MTTTTLTTVDKGRRTPTPNNLPTIPAISDSVIWQSQAFIVRDRTRTRATGTISLWLCDCHQLECQCDRKVPLEEVNKPDEVEAYIARELAVALQLCKTHQEVLVTVEDFTSDQRKAAWALLSKKRQEDLKKWKQVYELFPVGTSVRHKDVYMVAHVQHGTVDRTWGTEVIVCWAERENSPIRCERYEYTELEIRKEKKLAS